MESDAGWSRAIDAYCERLDAAFWAEPVNAITNAAFLLAAVLLWPRVQGPGLGLAQGLTVVLGAIGIGSFLFHTFATPWAAAADVIPIVAYVLVYIFAINRDVWQMRPWVAAGATGLFLPYAALTIPLWQVVPVLGVSAGYMPVPTLIVIYALLLRRRTPELSRGLLIGAGILMVSLTLRSVDEPLCHAFPLGTHFFWHVLNAVMLGWMIAVYVRFLRQTPA